MFIQTETTDNPDTIRFLPGETVYSEGPLFFDSSEKAINAPLAARLFELSDVEAVEIGVDSVSVTKMTQVDWLTLKPAVLGAIMDHFVSGQLAVIEEGKSISSERELGSGDELELDESDPIVVEIKDLIETRIRPAAVQSGGDIFLRGYKKGTAYFEFQGGASQLMSGLENMLRHYIPEINKIADVSSISIDIEKNIPKAEKTNSNGIAVVIGNRDYQNNVYDVEFAIRDASWMKEYLTTTLGYKAGNIIYLEDATLSELKTAIKKLENRSKKSSEIFVL